MWNQTPHQLYGVMFSRKVRAATEGPTTLAPLEGLTKANLLRAKKGLLPISGGMFKLALQSVPDAKGGKRGGK